MLAHSTRPCPTGVRRPSSVPDRPHRMSPSQSFDRRCGVWAVCCRMKRCRLQPCAATSDAAHHQRVTLTVKQLRRDQGTLTRLPRATYQVAPGCVMLVCRRYQCYRRFDTRNDGMVNFSDFAAMLADSISPGVSVPVEPPNGVGVSCAVRPFRACRCLLL